MTERGFKAIVLDLGNVMFEWSTEPTSNIKTTLSSIMRSEIYVRYETGLLGSADDFYTVMGQELGISAEQVRKTFQRARQSIRGNMRLLEVVKKLKDTTGIAVYAMSNIPKSEIDSLNYDHSSTMSVFDRVFASGYLGARKPDAAFYRMVIESTDIDPRSMIFIDDKIQNVEAACTLGMHGIQFRSTETLCDQLQNLLQPVDKP